MNQQTVSLDVAIAEHRHDFVCNTTAQVVTSLEDQGFTFEELLDGLANYAWMNGKGTDAVCYLVQASLLVGKTDM
jgi:hypothetical protein